MYAAYLDVPGSTHLNQDIEFQPPIKQILGKKHRNGLKISLLLGKLYHEHILAVRRITCYTHSYFIINSLTITVITCRNLSTRD